MTWTDFLEANHTRYLEARQWRDAGLSWQDVLATWHKGDDLLWAAQVLGLLDAAAAARVACACVDAVSDLAPDVDAVVGAVWDGDMVAAWHERVDVEDAAPGAHKARYAAERLLSGDNPNVMYHAAQARVHDARNAWAQALRDGESKPVIAELEAAIKRVEDAANLAQADFIRWLLGGLV